METGKYPKERLLYQMRKSRITLIHLPTAGACDGKHAIHDDVDGQRAKGGKAG
jgi:hypothetical protein